MNNVVAELWTCEYIAQSIHLIIIYLDLWLVFVRADLLAYTLFRI